MSGIGVGGGQGGGRGAPPNEFVEKMNLLRNRIEVVMACPYCGQETRLRKSYDPVKTGERKAYECEKCGKFFYGIVEVQTVKMSY